MLKFGENGIGVGNLITEFNRLAKSIPNADSVIKEFNRNVQQSVSDWVQYGESIGTTDKHMLSYLKTTKAGEATVEGYNAHIKSLGKSFDLTAIKAKALNIALNMGAMIVVTLAVQGAIKVFDALTTTLEETQERVQNLTSEYETINQEIEDLSQKELTSPMDNALTESEIARLEYLQNYRAELEETLRIAKEKDIRTEFFGGTFDSGLSGDFNNLARDIKLRADEIQSIIDMANNPDIGKISIKDNLGEFLLKSRFNADPAKAVREEYEKLQPEYEQLIELEGKLKEAIEATSNETDRRNLSDMLERVKSSLLGAGSLIDGLRQTGYVAFNTISNAVAETGDTLEEVSEKDELVSTFNTLDESVQKYLTSLNEAEKSSSKSSIENALKDISEQAEKGTISWTEYEKASKQASLALQIGAGDIGGQISELQSSYELLNTTQKEVSKTGEITAETFSSILDLVPEAASSMGDYADVIDKVKNKISEQEDVAVLTYGNIVLANDEAVNSILSSQSSLPSALSTYYGTDYENFVKTSDGKYKVEAKTVSKLSELWAKYAGMSAGAIDAQINSMARAGVSGNLSAENEQIMKDMILYRDLFKSIEQSFNEFAPDYTKPKSKSSKNEKDTWLEAYQKEYEELKFLRDTDQITAQEYYNRLEALDKKYFAGKDKYISEHRKNLEELYKLQKTIFDDYINDAEHGIAILERGNGTESEQIAAYTKLQEDIHDQANKYREMGLDENSNQIQELQKQWWSYADKISDIEDSIFNESKNKFEKYVNSMEHQISQLERGNLTENQQISLYTQLQQKLRQQGEYYKSLNRDDEEELLQDLETQWWGYADKINGINKSLLDKRIDAYKSYIDTTNKYGKWGSDNEIAALNRAKAEIEDYYRAGKIYAKDYAEYIKQINKDIADSTDNLYQKYRDAMVSKVDSQIDELNKKLDEQNEIYDQQIEALEKEKDLMREQADEADRLLKIEELRMALEKAKSQKNAQIYREGLGIVYEVDEDAVREAQNALNDELAKDELRQKENEIDKQIQDLEDLKDANEKSIKAQIDNLEKLKDEWEKSLDIELEVEDFEGVLKGLTKFEQDEFGTRLENVTEFRKAYLAEMAQITAAQGSPFATSDGNTYYAGMDGSAPKNAQIGDNILTGGGTYRIVAPGTEGSSYNPNSGFYSVKIDDLSTAITTQNENTVLQTSAVKSNTTAVSNSKNTIDKSNLLVDKGNTLVDKGNTLTDINNTSVGKNTNELDNNSDELSSLSYGVYLLTDAINNMPEPSSDNGSSDVTTGESHTGGIVGGKGYHEELIDLAKNPLKPNESIRILEKGEGIFTSGMMDNIISMINTSATLSMPNLTAVTPKNTQPLPIDMTIQANFPNVSSESEIKKALMSLPQVAVQYINRS